MYGALTTFRNYLYDQGILRSQRVALPVVSVGNFVAGGSGKTPLVMHLVEMLKAHGHEPVVLSRGYGGAVRGPHVVRKEDTADLVGDEPLLMAHTLDVPVVIARKRIDGARLVQERSLGTVIVLDDGFQHRALSRDLDIVCVDVTTEKRIQEFCRGKLLPVGRFRESRDRGFARVQVVVCMHRCFLEAPPPVDPRIREIVPSHIPILSGWIGAARVVDQSGRTLSPCAVYLVTGIANPEGVIQTVTSLGFTVVGHARFSDHHRFSRGDILRVRAEAGNARLVCTQKDIVKLEALAEGEFCPIEPQYMLCKEAELIQLLLRAGVIR